MGQECFVINPKEKQTNKPNKATFQLRNWGRSETLTTLYGHPGLPSLTGKAAPEGCSSLQTHSPRLQLPRIHRIGRTVPLAPGSLYKHHPSIPQSLKETKCSNACLTSEQLQNTGHTPFCARAELRQTAHGEGMTPWISVAPKRGGGHLSWLDKLHYPFTQSLIVLHSMKLLCYYFSANAFGGVPYFRVILTEDEENSNHTRKKNSSALVATTAEFHSHSALSFQVLHLPQTPPPLLEQVPLPCGVLYVSVWMWGHMEMGGCKWRGPRQDPDSELPSVKGSSPRILPLPAPSITTHPQISRRHGGHCAPEGDLAWLPLVWKGERLCSGSPGKAEGSCLIFVLCFPSCFLAAMNPWNHSHTSDKPSPWHLFFPSPFLLCWLQWPLSGPCPIPPCGIPPAWKCHLCAPACAPGQPQTTVPSPEAKNHSSGNAQMEIKESSLGPCQCGTGLTSAQLGHPAVAGAVQRTVVRRKEILWCQAF